MSRHLMGPGEIRERLGGLSRQRIHQITSDPTFPKPYDELRMGKVWRVEDVEDWIRTHAAGNRRRGVGPDEAGDSSLVIESDIGMTVEARAVPPFIW